MPNILDEIPQVPPVTEMDEPPTFGETLDAIKSLKNNKSPGPDGLPSELYKEGGYFLHSKYMSSCRSSGIPKKLPLIF